TQAKSGLWFPIRPGPPINISPFAQAVPAVSIQLFRTDIGKERPCHDLIFYQVRGWLRFLYEAAAPLLNFQAETAQSLSSRFPPLQSVQGRAPSADINRSKTNPDL